MDYNGQALLETSTVSKEKAEADLVSFKDCPNKCVNGFIYNPYAGRKHICTYCEEKRKKLLHDRATLVNTEGSTVGIHEELGLEKSLIGLGYDFDAVIPSFAAKMLTPESIESIKGILQDLINSSNIGELPNQSILLNLGSKVCWENFIYPYMMNYYREGRSLTPLLTPLDICRYRGYAEQYGIQDNFSISYFTLLERDICVIHIDAGVTKHGIDAVKGLMQLRASKRKATLILTDYWGSALESLHHSEGIKYMNMARLYSVVYTQKAAETERKREEQLCTASTRRQPSQVSQDDFKALLGKSSGNLL